MTQKSKKNRQILVPQYMHDFSCIGSKCEDSCCIGWRVQIDENTYKKYKKSKDIELKPLFEKNVTRQRSNSSSISYAKVKMQEGGRCSFLTEENLCKIQLNLGDSFLSNICTDYPRIFNSINDIIEKSANMSCPEAARLALLNPNRIAFDEIEEPADTKGYISKSLNTDNHISKNSIKKYFWELRIFTIQVLQNRMYPLTERLIILGIFYQKLQNLLDQGDVEIIPSTIAQYTNWIDNHQLEELLQGIPTQLMLQMELCKKLIDYRYSQGIDNQRYIECLAEMLLGIKYTGEETIEEVTEHYNFAFNEYYKPFIKEHEYILENYLVNYVFKNLYPLANKAPFEDYVMLVIYYAMIKLHLIGMAGFHKGLSKELVIKLIQSFSKTVEHNTTYLKNIFDFLKVNEFTTMPYMSILIKN